MKYYKNPVPETEKEVINPCTNCVEESQSVLEGKDELGEYIDFISCKDTCELRKQYLNNYSNNIYSEYVDEEQMRKLKESENK